MSHKMTAPVADSKRIDNVELLPAGFQVCTLYSMNDIGTQDSNFGPKRQVRLVFEFPQHTRVFYEGDSAKPCSIFCTETFSMNEKANLRKKFVEGMIGKKLTDDEAAAFDISTLLGRHAVASIIHSDDGKWANISSLAPLDENSMKMFGLTSPVISQVNPSSFYSLSQGFDGEPFANLSTKVRELLMMSQEGKAHKLAGGVFAEKSQGNSSASGTATPPPSNVGSGIAVKMKDGLDYAAHINAGWSDEQLVEHGKAEWNKPVAPPTPVSSPAPTAPPVSSAPVTPPAPVSAPAPVAPVTPKLVFNDPNAQPLEEWLKAGWTEQTIVDAGHASFQ